MRRDIESVWSMDCSPDLVLRLEDSNLRTEKRKSSNREDAFSGRRKKRRAKRIRME